DVARDQRAQPLGQELRVAIGRVDGLDKRRAHRWKRRKRILVERQRQRVKRTGQRPDGLGQLALERGHQSRPPHLIAAAPAKSPACANAAIITTSPFLSVPSEMARSRLIGIPAANRFPQSSNVSTWRSFGSSSASRQFRRNTRLGWFVTSKSRSLGCMPIRSQTAYATSGT